MSGGNVRQELYDRIRESSKDEVILEEMIRLGFWPRGEGQPSVPEGLIKRQGEISRELNDLAAKQRLWSDPERALKEMHKQRKRAAMERRQQTKLRNAQLRHERALAWAERRTTAMLYLGPDVSGGLSKGAEARPHLPWLDTRELPSPRALADAMGIGLAELRFLAFDRPLSRVSHYQRFVIPKKTGGDRLISAPMPRLKRAQYWVLDNILAALPVHEAVHGFAPDRSIVSNALPHVGRDVVVNIDLQDFFPTLTWKRVKGKFRGLGYSEAVATVLALICTEPDVDAVELDGQRLYARKGPRRLPQGAPTSPALTNLICARLDRRMAGIAARLGFTYTRYADDMTFSASGDSAAKTGTLLKAVGDIVAAEGFTVHPDKTRVMRKHRRQEVTGLVVNERLGVPRDTLRRFRALLHQIHASGPAGKRWGSGGDVLSAAVGFAQFVRMVDDKAGAPLVAEAKALERQHRGTPAKAPVNDFRRVCAKGKPPLDRWWTPNEARPPKPEPVLARHIEAQTPAPTQAAAPQRPVPPGTQTVSQPQPTARTPAASQRQTPAPNGHAPATARSTSSAQAAQTRAQPQTPPATSATVTAPAQAQPRVPAAPSTPSSEDSGPSVAQARAASGLPPLPPRAKASADAPPTRSRARFLWPLLAVAGVASLAVWPVVTIALAVVVGGAAFMLWRKRR